MKPERREENPFRLHLRLWVLCAFAFWLVEASLSARVGPWTSDRFTWAFLSLLFYFAFAGGGGALTGWLLRLQRPGEPGKLERRFSLGTSLLLSLHLGPLFLFAHLYFRFGGEFPFYDAYRLFWEFLPIPILVGVWAGLHTVFLRRRVTMDRLAAGVLSAALAWNLACVGFFVIHDLIPAENEIFLGPRTGLPAGVLWVLSLLLGWGLLRWTGGKRGAGFGLLRPLGGLVFSALLLYGLPTGLLRGSLPRQGVQASLPGRPLPKVASPIFLIVVDTLRASDIGPYGGPRTPYLERLVKEGVLFEQAFTASTTSGESHASLFTGLYPTRHGLLMPRRDLPSGVKTIAEVLQSAGYETASFSNNPLISREMGFARGFDTFILPERWQWAFLREDFHFLQWMRFLELPSRKDKGAEWTAQLVRRWFHHRPEPEKPFFVFINYFEPHYPYGAKAPFWAEELSNGPAVQEARRRYLEAIAYMDRQLESLLETPPLRAAMEKGVVVLTSDHGETFGENGVFGHGHYLYDPALRVPLILRLPRTLAGETLRGKRVSHPVSTLGVVATLLEVAGLPEDALQTQAGSLLLLARGRGGPEVAILNETPIEQDDFHLARAILYQGYKLILGVRERGSELFHLASDPGEKVNLYERLPDKAAELLIAMGRALASVPPFDTPEAPWGPRLEDSVVKRLRALGYLVPDAP